MEPQGSNGPGILTTAAEDDVASATNLRSTANVELAPQRAFEVLARQDVDVVPGRLRLDILDRLQWQGHAAGLGERGAERDDHRPDLPRWCLSNMGGERLV